MAKAYKILIIGEQWDGSDVRSMLDGFKLLGHCTIAVDPRHFLATCKNFFNKVVNRFLRKRFIAEFNLEILNIDNIFRPDLIIVFKGTEVLEETLVKLKERKRSVVNYYPDVSMFAHGVNISQCLPVYDHIFTSKTFGDNDLKAKGINKSSLVVHAASPFVHRPLNNISDEKFKSETSFIGTWSPKKAEYLKTLLSLSPNLDLKIWGSQWDKAHDESLKKHIQYTHILGDLYALAISLCDINIALLSEQRNGSSDGDQITSRTFHIPASGGFMLHERTDELLEYFDEDVEVACFSSPEEMNDKVKYFLAHPDIRKNIAKAGYERCIKENLWLHRAEKIINICKEISLLE